MESDDKEVPTLLYDRQRRMSRAGPDARFAESLHGGAKLGLLRSLVATRGLRLMLLLVAVTAAAVAFVRLAGADASSRALGDWSYAADAVWFEGDAYVTVSRTPRRAGAVAGEVRASVGFDAAGPAVGGDALLAAGETDLRLRIAAPQKPRKAAVSLSSGDGEITLTAPIR